MPNETIMSDTVNPSAAATSMATTKAAQAGRAGGWNEKRAQLWPPRNGIWK